MPTVLSLLSEHCRETFARVAEVIRAGGIVAVPTESSYGLAVSPFHDEAVNRIFTIKGRAGDKPILVLIGDRAQVHSLVVTVPLAAEPLMVNFWPGPLTIVMDALPSLPQALTAGTGSIGVRLPSVPVLCDLLREVGPLTGTSANRAGEQPLATAHQVLSGLGGHVDLILDSGGTPGGLPSTVLDVRASVRLLREGAVPRTVIASVLEGFGVQLSP
ncbi:MAG: L-threonylcarbamoyladenylate synthase [Nitrospiraceae bacterium]